VITSSSQPVAIVGRVEPMREVRQDGGDAAHHAGQHEQQETDAINAHAGEQRRHRIVADSVDAPTQGRVVEDNSENDCEHQEKNELEGNHPPDVALAEILKASRILAIGLVPEDDIGDAPEEAHRADGDDDRRDAKPGNDESVEGAGCNADRNATTTRTVGPAPVVAIAPMAVEDSAIIDETERSISPATMSSAMANAMIAFSVKLKVASERLYG